VLRGSGTQDVARFGLVRCISLQGRWHTVADALEIFAGSADAAFGLRSCSFTAVILAASAAGRALGATGADSAAEKPPGTNSAAVGFRDPLVRIVFRPGACKDPEHFHPFQAQHSQKQSSDWPQTDHQPTECAASTTIHQEYTDICWNTIRASR